MEFSCVVAINRTFVLLIGVDDTSNPFPNHKVLSYDFKLHIWSHRKEIPHDISVFSDQVLHTTCTVMFEKLKKYVYVITSSYSNYWAFGKWPESIFWQYDHEINDWRKMSTYQLDDKGELISLQGILHYILYSNTGKSLGYYFDKKNNTFKYLSEPPLNNSITGENIFPFITLANCYV